MKDFTSQLPEGFLILYVLALFNVILLHFVIFNGVRFEANLKKKLETCWLVRNSELVKRWFSLLFLAVILNLATEAASAFWPVVSPIRNLLTK